MLVVLSDLHLTDGTSCETLDSGAFRIFSERLQDLAVRASWRSDGQYRPIPRIDIVLLGDVLDIMRSSRWLIDGAKPWGSDSTAEFTQRVGSVVSGILTRNLETAAILKSLSRRQTIRVPAMASDGKPTFEDDLQPVPVRIHYMVGNADWPLHLADPEMSRVRGSIIEAFGLNNTPGKPFAHEPLEDTTIQAVLQQHRVFARHGDVFDPLCFTGQRDRCSLADIILIEGLTRFRFEIQHGLGQQLPASCQLGIQELDHVRPLVMAPICLRQMMKISCPVTSLQFEIKNCWDRVIEQMMPLIYRIDRESPLGVRDLEEMGSLLKFRCQDNDGWGERMMNWIRKQGVQKSLSKRALDESEFRNRRAKHIVFGHTHSDETVPLDASFADGFMLSQLYFNSGTWRRVYTPTCGTESWREFLPSEKMTYLTFYCDDERQGAAYEVWSGILGTAPSPIRRIRVDSAQSAMTPKSRHVQSAPLRYPAKSMNLGGHSIPAPPTAVPSIPSTPVRPANERVPQNP
ncbi:hypothetical protein [Bremerella cremea]|uniref:hypothetical protein n=1 Tax=Bremerella cremea TaxID=1031537 RepID=UPI0031EE744B